MKCLKLTFALLFALSQTVVVTAQVKKTYQDTNNAATTVVVKEDGVDDYDVLENNFDIDEYGIGQVIRITTEADKPTESMETLSTEPKPVTQVQEVSTNAPNRAIQPVESMEVLPTQPQPVTQLQEVVLTNAPNRASQPAEVADKDNNIQEVTPLENEAPEILSENTVEAPAVGKNEKAPETTVEESFTADTSKKVIKQKSKRKRVKNNRSFQRKKFRIRINLRLFKGGKGAKCYSF